MLLPRPIRVDGPKAQVGDEATCVYSRGELVKRVTRVEKPRRYDFVVVGQRLVFGGGIRLTGGSYALQEAGPGTTDVAVTTTFAGMRQPRWLWLPIETAVCHRFHRYLMQAL